MKELELLNEYMSVLIQLLPFCLSGKYMRIQQLPTFEYFKETYEDPRYSLVIPHFKESRMVYNNQICQVYTHGLGSDDGIAYRYYNRYLSCKYFTGGNLDGRWTINIEMMQEVLK